MFVDSHCHLSFPELYDHRADRLREMVQAGVSRALCVCTTLEEFDRVHSLTQEHANLWCSVGVHPDNENVREPDVATLVDLAQRDKVIAMGETGLDYHDMQGRKGGRSIADMEWQRNRFRAHIRAAQQVSKPLIIHTRSASEDTVAILKEEGEGTDQRAGGVFHCFTETADVARAALDLGYYISFSGIITFKSAQDLRDVVAFVPMDRMLIETDSPYLAPVPFRGKLNHPALVAHVAAEVARIKQTTVQAVAVQTTANFDRLFTGARVEQHAP
jgi:TatD DNase family protein